MFKDFSGYPIENDNMADVDIAELPHADVEDIMTQVKGGHLLYADERGRLISILSTKVLKNLWLDSGKGSWIQRKNSNSAAEPWDHYE